MYDLGLDMSLPGFVEDDYHSVSMKNAQGVTEKVLSRDLSQYHVTVIVAIE